MARRLVAPAVCSARIVGPICSPRRGARLQRLPRGRAHLGAGRDAAKTVDLGDHQGGPVQPRRGQGLFQRHSHPRPLHGASLRPEG
jgi:hypothetical protein